MNKLLVSLAVGLVLTASSVASAQDQLRAERMAMTGIPGSIQGLKLATPLQVDGVKAASMQRSALFHEGANQVLIRLISPSVSEQKVRGKSAQSAKKALQNEQADLLAQILALDPNARILGQTQIVMNAIFVEVDASVLDALAGHPAVLRMVPVSNYEVDLSETVPYIGAAAVQLDGFDGTGVSVAVLDSGIDYYHAALGGSGNPADYAADDPTVIEPGTFPTAKVVDGYDFVGSD
ncbi:MAG: hypothetical protein KJN94_07605, partial [Gammaproteobacteria bacterium]|nr:hypothetical protein [Gammaproteobacteria bacterium]